MNSLIIGLGEIGKSVKEVIEPFDKVSTYDINQENFKTPQIDVMHICFPYDEATFEKSVQDYITKYEPKHVIVWSTVQIGTCKRLGITHTPVEGRHPKLAESIRKMRRWVGSCDEDELRFFIKYFEDRAFTVNGVSNSDFTEFLKLRSTSKYGINLVWTDYEKSVADSLKMDFTLLKDFDTDYNDLYQELGMPWAQRYILDAPDNGLGGHCLIENAVLLDEQYPSNMLKKMLSLGKNIETIKEDKPYLNRAWLYAEYWGKGRSTEYIGKEWGCTGANIIRLMKKFDIKRRTLVWTDEEVQTLIDLSATETFKDISESVGKTHDATRLMAIKLGLKSVYNPGYRNELTRQKISASLQGITTDEWDGFKESVNQLIRKSEAMQSWRKSVFERDDYTCQHCGSRSGNGKKVILHADHIKPFATHIELRFDVDNGRTLCLDCHKKTDTYGGKTRTRK